MTVLDLAAGTGVIDVFNSNPIQAVISDTNAIGVSRLTLFHLIVTLHKILEIYKRYKPILPTEVALEFKNLAKEIDARGVPAFRNKVIGHIWDADLRRPLLANEIQLALSSVTQGDPAAFLNWINPRPEPCSTSVVAIVERVRDSIGEKYDVDGREIGG
ncbi:MAG: hypothetical protein IBJ03_06425 [Gemmatimonadaceae bacterium]|nr:hypothetical protein [Gemmatimonadaceae bacterium]